MMFRTKTAKVLAIVAFALILLLIKSFFMPVFEEERAKPMLIERKIMLPEPSYSSNISIEEAILRRRSIRDYTPENLSLEELSQLLWAAQGITYQKKGFRASPSAGALYPLELYVVTTDGIFHYNPFEHCLEQGYKGDVRKALAKAAVDQKWIADAPVSIVITGVFERITKKYGGRGERYVYMEAGHVAQNIYLECVSLDLGTVVVGAFYDQQVQEVLKLPEDHKPLYIMPVGHPKAG
jgi:SagB-type dehydrogenase family enzyme